MAAFNYGLKHDNDPANFIDDAKFGFALIRWLPYLSKGRRACRGTLSDVGRGSQIA